MTYEYRCASCDHAFETQQRITDEPLLHCPFCGKPKLQRLVSGGSGIVFQGAGWARDLYSKDRAPRKE